MSLVCNNGGGNETYKLINQSAGGGVSEEPFENLDDLVRSKRQALGLRHKDEFELERVRIFDNFSV